MLPTLQEKHTHGTTTFPLQVYSHHDKDGFYSVAQHWHEELEWVYVETGVLELTVRGKSYLLHPGEFCFVNSGELHEIRSTANPSTTRWCSGPVFWILSCTTPASTSSSAP